MDNGRVESVLEEVAKMSLQFVNKNGEVVRLTKPHRNNRYQKKTYTMSSEVRGGVITDTVKAMNGYTAMLKFVLKHPLVLFKVN